MTCIIGLVENNTMYVGGDSAGVSGLDLTIRKDVKVFQKESMLIGYSGSFRMGQLLRFSLQLPEHPPDMPDYTYMCTFFIDAVRECLKKGGFTLIKDGVEEIDGEFIVCYHNCVYNIEIDFQVGISSDNYYAIGCGRKYALGAMEVLTGKPEERIEKALAVASKFSAGVRPPFKVLYMEEEISAEATQ